MKWAEVSVVIICLDFEILRLVYFLCQQVFKNVCQKVTIFFSFCALPTRKDTIHNKWAVQEGSTIDFWIDKILTLKARFSKWYNSFRINLTNTICLLNKKEIKVNNKLHYFLLNEPKLKWWVYFNSNISGVSSGVQYCILKL